jgi:hypothetical protein
MPGRTRSGLIAYAGAALCVVALTAGSGHAQDLEPRAFGNTPVGLNFLIAGYSYSEGGLSTNPALPLEDAELRVNTAFLAYAYALDVWGKSGKVDAVLPYTNLSGTASFAGETVERDVTGFGDPRFRFSVLLFGAPALSLKDFASFHQDTIIGVSLQVSAPVGQYDSSRAVNIGTNRWAVKPEIGMSKALGPLTLELSTSMAFYSRNDDYFGGSTIEQDPMYSAQVHAIYNFGRGVWGALDGTYYAGGRTTIDGVSGDQLGSSRVGVTLALPVNRRNSIKLYASTGVSTRTGTDFDTGGIAWQFRWGAGL